jgi:hypothetical protein
MVLGVKLNGPILSEQDNMYTFLHFMFFFTFYEQYVYYVQTGSGESSSILAGPSQPYQLHRRYTNQSKLNNLSVQK